MAMNSWGIVYENAELVLFIEPQRFLAILWGSCEAPVGLLWGSCKAPGRLL